MAAVEISEPGAPDVLKLVRRPVPEPGSGDVLIRVAAAGVNRPDCLQRQGLYPPPPGASDLPGLEVAGTIVATGDNAGTHQVGDPVCALLTGGGYAEYCVAPGVQCLPVPHGMTMIQAAALPETFFTVWSNLFMRGNLQAGESILIHGGASGIGTTAIQLAKTFGARVYATAGTDEKCTLCESLGATRAMNYHTENFADTIKETTDGRGVDIILDIVGGPYLDDNLKSLQADGRLIVIALLGGGKAEVNLGRLMMRRLTITGSTLRAREPGFKATIADELRAQVWPKITAGEIAPVIQETFSLENAAAAHEILDAEAAMGKLVLRVSD
jgi:NADPH2:quinone reductase